MRTTRKTLLSAGVGVLTKVARAGAAQTLLFNAIRLARPEVLALMTERELRFLAYAFANRSRSRAQLLQDLWVCFELDEARNGFFVEFGATDGLTSSNTWLLEKRHGWTGILAEPNPSWQPALARNRCARIDHRCVSSTSGAIMPFVTTNNSDPELSGLAAFSAGHHFDGQRRAGDHIDVRTVSLNDLLSEHEAPDTIDYMSIDTEGSELHILQNFDFAKFRVSLLSVERSPETRDGLDALLRQNGFVEVLPNLSQWDGWYITRALMHRPSPPIVAPAA